MTPLDIARGEIGVAESPRNSNKTKYGAWYGVNGVPWCMIFVQWCFDQSGNALPYKTASCSGLLNWVKKNRKAWISTDPQPGDIIIYTFGHTGILEQADAASVTAIEGNTAIGNDTNGGSVMRRVRSRAAVQAYIRPEIKEEKMQTVKGATASENAMIKAIQKAVGAVQDGEIGTQTMSDIACLLGADCFPLTLQIYSQPVIIAKDIVPFALKTRAADWTNSISGSFSANGRPCSILIQDGSIRQQYACHAVPYGQPESVLYKTQGGKVDIARVLNAADLPGAPIWAVGGLGLLGNYAPNLEGFCKLSANGKTEDFSDVLRATNHTMLGTKNGYMFLVYCKNMTAAQVNAHAKKLGLEKAIMLDGGHVAAIKGTEGFAQINLSQTQYYMIQGKRA